MDVLVQHLQDDTKWTEDETYEVSLQSRSRDPNRFLEAEEDHCCELAS
jgi:hypothetical protein